MPNQYSLSFSSYDTCSAESRSLRVDYANVEIVVPVADTRESQHNVDSGDDFSASSPFEDDGDDSSRVSVVSDESFDGQQDPVTVMYRNGVVPLTSSSIAHGSQHLDTRAAPTSSPTVTQSTNRTVGSTTMLGDSQTRQHTSFGSSPPQQQVPAPSPNFTNLLASFQWEPQLRDRSEWDSDDDPDEEEEDNLVLSGQHLRGWLRPQQVHENRGVCPDYLRSIPRLHLLEGSPSFFQVEIKLSNGKVIEGSFLADGVALKAGKHSMSVEFSKQDKKSFSLLVKGTSKQSSVLSEQQYPPLLLTYYAWITDNVNLDHSKAVPVIQIKQKDIAQLSSETQPFEITVKREIPSCAICAEEYEVGQSVLWLVKCGHFYHESCVLTWLQNHNTCPTCRYVLPFAL